MARNSKRTATAWWARSKRRLDRARVVPAELPTWESQYFTQSTPRLARPQFMRCGQMRDDRGHAQLQRLPRSAKAAVLLLLFGVFVVIGVVVIATHKSPTTLAAGGGKTDHDRYCRQDDNDEPAPSRQRPTLARSRPSQATRSTTALVTSWPAPPSFRHPRLRRRHDRPVLNWPSCDNVGHQAGPTTAPSLEKNDSTTRLSVSKELGRTPPTSVHARPA